MKKRTSWVPYLFYFMTIAFFIGMLVFLVLGIINTGDTIKENLYCSLCAGCFGACINSMILCVLTVKLK